MLFLSNNTCARKRKKDSRVDTRSRGQDRKKKKKRKKTPRSWYLSLKESLSASVSHMEEWDRKGDPINHRGFEGKGKQMHLHQHHNKDHVDSVVNPRRLIVVVVAYAMKTQKGRREKKGIQSHEKKNKTGEEQKKNFDTWSTRRSPNQSPQFSRYASISMKTKEIKYDENKRN